MIKRIRQKKSRQVHRAGTKRPQPLNSSRGVSDGDDSEVDVYYFNFNVVLSDLSLSFESVLSD